MDCSSALRVKRSHAGSDGGVRIRFGHRLVAAAIYQSSTIADRLATQPRCQMRSAPTTIDGCGTLKRLLQFILRAARR